VVLMGINNLVPKTGITQTEARRKLGIAENAHVVLFFGYINQYKGTDVLLDAVARMANDDPALTLLLAGQYKCSPAYRQTIETLIAHISPTIPVKTYFEYVATERVEEFFAAADCVALPYRSIFQSAVIFLAYRFGVPLVAADVGSFREDILEGETGFLCPPNDAPALAAAIRTYFSSKLFLQKAQTRTRIAQWAEEKYSWNAIGKRTAGIYSNLLDRH
jgi:glycosyltransferase involved in cell wall biosynthesis